MSNLWGAYRYKQVPTLPYSNHKIWHLTSLESEVYKNKKKKIFRQIKNYTFCTNCYHMQNKLSIIEKLSLTEVEKDIILTQLTYFQRSTVIRGRYSNNLPQTVQLNKMVPVLF